MKGNGDCLLLQHIKELSSVFQEIFVNTSSSSIDHATLRQVTHGESLREAKKHVYIYTAKCFFLL